MSRHWIHTTALCHLSSFFCRPDQIMVILVTDNSSESFKRTIGTTWRWCRQNTTQMEKPVKVRPQEVSSALESILHSSLLFYSETSVESVTLKYLCIPHWCERVRRVCEPRTICSIILLKLCIKAFTHLSKSQETARKLKMSVCKMFGLKLFSFSASLGATQTGNTTIGWEIYEKFLTVPCEEGRKETHPSVMNIFITSSGFKRKRTGGFG